MLNLKEGTVFTIPYNPTTYLFLGIFEDHILTEYVDPITFEPIKNSCGDINSISLQSTFLAIKAIGRKDSGAYRVLSNRMLSRCKLKILKHVEVTLEEFVGE